MKNELVTKRIYRKIGYMGKSFKNLRREIDIIQLKSHIFLKFITLACLFLCYQIAYAVELGNAVVHSTLGQVLHVQIPVTGATENSVAPGCIKPEIESMSGTFIDIPNVEITASKTSKTLSYINLVSKKEMQEPAIKLSIALTCDVLIQREYALILDYAGSPQAALITPESKTSPNAQTSDDGVENVEDKSTVSNLIKPTSVKPTESIKKKDKSEPLPGSAIKKSADVQVNAKQESPSVPQQALASVKDVAKTNDAAKSNDVAKTSDVAKTTAETKTNQEAVLPDANLKTPQTVAAQPPQQIDQKDPLLSTPVDTLIEQQKNKALTMEVERLKLQNSLEMKQEKSASSEMNWVISVIAVLFCVFIVMLMIMMRSSRRAKEKFNLYPLVEQKKNDAEQVGLPEKNVFQESSNSSSVVQLHDKKTQVPTPEAGSTRTVHRTEELNSNQKVKHEPEQAGAGSSEENNNGSFLLRNQSVQIEEISDTTQEAEFWMSVNNPQRAIEVLEPQAVDDNPSNPITWLYLIDLYKIVNDEGKYWELKRRLKRKFNVKILGFHEAPDPSQFKYFEDFPHLLTTCCKLWHSDKIISFLESLLVDDRDGDRVGFDLPMYRDILLLLSIARELQQTKPPSSNESTNVVLPIEIPDV